MFSRRHYIVIAASLALIENVDARRQAAHLQADIFEKDNPKKGLYGFDRRRFLIAAGVL